MKVRLTFPEADNLGGSVKDVRGDYVGRYAPSAHALQREEHQMQPQHGFGQVDRGGARG